MAGIYIHIPFCKRVCSYCDFYKTTVLSFIPDYLTALEKELEIRKSYLGAESVETIYIGGGTPSLLNDVQLAGIFEKINRNFTLEADCEITLEANPDDLNPGYLRNIIKNTPVNRLSIGVQSFHDADLRFLNRRHNVSQALSCIRDSQSLGFHNLSIDLIYGIPGMTLEKWTQNLERAFFLDIQHLSAYHLTVEKGTSLHKKLGNGDIKTVPEEESLRQFAVLGKMAAEHAFIHYEISNLAREGFFSKHNSNYWNEKKYLGVGPGAHSYDLKSRQWNIPDAKKYIEAIDRNELFFESEELDDMTRYNERLMVTLRTRRGLNAESMLQDFGEEKFQEFLKAVQPHILYGYIFKEGRYFRMTEQGWLVSDRIIADMMLA
jgi:oxygen-independent coproporphyrinogen-3 oxidase